MPENNKTPDNLNIQGDEKKAKELVFDHLKQGIREIMETDKFKDWLKSSGKLYLNNYSFNNAVLVFLNDPKNTYTMGYEAWKEFGRQVGGGAKAIQILAPIFAKETEKNGLYKSIRSDLVKQLEGNPSLEYSSHKLGQSKLGFTMQHNGIMGLTVNGQEARRFNSDDEVKKFIAREVLGKVAVYFNAVNVFDVSKTITPEYLWLKKGQFKDDELFLDEKGEPVKNQKGEYKIINTPERQAKFKPEIDLAIKENDAKKMETLFSVLQKVSGDKGIPMTVEPIADKDMLGYYERPRAGEQGKGRVVISDALTPTQRVSTAFHELTHGDLHGNLQKLQERLGVRADRGMREVQAEAAAYITANNFGIETDTRSFNYLAAWSKGKELKDLEISLELIYQESKSLMKDIEKELDNRGLTLTLEPKNQEPLKEDEKSAVLKNYAEYILNKSEEYGYIGTDITNELGNAANGDEKDIIQSQYGLVMNTMSDLTEMNQLFNALEKSVGRAEQNELIKKINAVQYRISQTENEMVRLSETRIDVMRNDEQPTLKQQFLRNPASVVERLLPNLKPDEVKYIAASKYISGELSGLLNKNPQQFIDEVNIRLAAIEKVRADNGAFVEVTKCDQWGETPIFEDGSLVHPRLADRIVGEAETQTRMFKEEAARYGDYYPNAQCDVIIYSYNGKNELTAFNTGLEIGDGRQICLLDHMKEVLTQGYNKKEKSAVLDSLNEAAKEHNYIEKIYSPSMAVDDGAEDITVSELNQARNGDNGERDTNRYKSLQDWKEDIENSKTAMSNNKDEKEPVKSNSDRKSDRGD